MDDDLQALLDAAGIEADGALETVRDYPWSRVVRVPTAAGDVWAKRCGTACAYVPHLLRLFDEAGERLGPRLLGSRGSWLLTADAGATLFRALEGDAQAAAYARALADYVALQRRWTGRVEELVATGLEHHRLAELPALLLRLLDEPLVGEVPQPITGAEAQALRANLPEVAAMCARLAELGVADTLHHDDLHQGNVLVDAGGKVAIIDWGDASVAHPFFHLTMACWAISHERTVAIDAPSMQRLRDDYLDGWVDVAPLEQLRPAAAIAEHLGAVVRAESWLRGLADADAASVAEYGGPLAEFLRRLLPGGDDPVAVRARAALAG